jgi:hypothetical protein
MYDNLTVQGFALQREVGCESGQEQDQQESPESAEEPGQAFTTL